MSNKNAQQNQTDILRHEMMKTYLVGLMDESNCDKLMYCSPEVIEPIYNGATRFTPSSIFLNTGSEEDMAYIRQQAIANNEEDRLL